MSVIAEEVITPSLIAEMLALSRDYYEKCSGEITEPVRIDSGYYLDAALKGGLCLVTCRTAEGVLVGYALGLVLNSPTFDCRIGNVAMYYLDIKHRSNRNAINMLERLESLFKAKGCAIVETHSPIAGNICALFERIGFKAKDVIYQRRIK